MNTPIDFTIMNVRLIQQSARERWPKLFGFRAWATTAPLATGLIFALRTVLYAGPPSLTGTYMADDGGVYYVQQSGSTLWWAGMSLDQGILPDEVWHRGLSFTNVFRGTVNDDYTVTGEWSDVTRGTILQSGTLNLTVSYFNGHLRLTKTAATGGFGGTTLTQGNALDDNKVSGGTLYMDVIDRFHAVHKNTGETLLDGVVLGHTLPNLRPYRDQTVFYGRIVNSHIDYLHKVCAEPPSGGVQVCIYDFPVEQEIPHVNYGVDFPTPIKAFGFTYLNFGELDRDYSEFLVEQSIGDADFDVRMKVDQDKLEHDFYTTGWGNHTYGPEVFNLKLNDASTHQKLNYAGSDAYIGLETIMFGKQDSSSASLLPGWADVDGNSILVNGRPINGFKLSSDPPAYCKYVQPCPYLDAPDPATLLANGLFVSRAGIALGNLLESAYGNGKIPPDDGAGTYLRVTGTLILDCGHFVDLRGHTCFDGDGDDPNKDSDTTDDVSIHQNQEIHPVYSIDIINFPFRPEDITVDARRNLTGAWGAPMDGSTYYVRQIGNTVWWLSTMRDRQPIQRGTDFPIIGTYQLQAAFNGGDPTCSSNQCWAFATVFRGTVNEAGDTVEGDWAGVPQSTSLGSNGGHMKFYVYNHKIIVPATAGIFPVTIEKMYEPEDTTPPQSRLTIGTPQYPVGDSLPFVTSATPLTISALDQSSGVQNLWYRVFLSGTTPPSYTPIVGSRFTTTVTGPDGFYVVDFYATDNAGNDESVRTLHLVYLDNTAPVTTINQPAATQYPHNATLTLDYSVSDGNGSGVASFTATMDGALTLPDGHVLQSPPPPPLINLLTEMTLGSHTFSVTATDNLGNTGSNSVTFSIVVTPDSIKGDVNQFLGSGKIKNSGEANSLLAKLNAAAKARARGDCNGAANNYRAFISELQAQSGKGVDAAAAAIMIADAQYLMTHCP